MSPRPTFLSLNERYLAAFNLIKTMAILQRPFALSVPIFALIGCAAVPPSEPPHVRPSAERPSITLGSNAIDIPANIRGIVYYGSNRAGFQQGIQFLDAAGGVADTIDLGPKVPPGDCLGREPFARTLYLKAFSVSNGVVKPINVTRNADTRYYNVDIYDDTSSIVTETATIGIPTIPSLYCRSIP